MNEDWKDISGYEGRYKVSNTGLVKSCEHYHPVIIKGTACLRHRNEQLLKQWKRSSYLLVDLWRDSERDVRSIHLLVWEAFNGYIPEKYEIHHIDKNKFNNSINNLKLLSRKEHRLLHNNLIHGWNKGKKMPPEVHQKSWQTRRLKCQKKI